MKSERVTSCMVYPAVPDKLTEMGAKPCIVTLDKASKTVTMANGFLTVVISVKGGVLTAIENRLTGQQFELQGDRMALSLRAGRNGGQTDPAGIYDTPLKTLHLSLRSGRGRAVLYLAMRKRVSNWGQAIRDC